MGTLDTTRKTPPAADQMWQDAVPVAGGGLLDRRLFIKAGFVGGLTAGLSGKTARADTALETQNHREESNLAQPFWMMQPGAPFSNYGQPSLYEKEAVRWITANSEAPGNGISWTPLHNLDGILTPNGLHFERHHNGVPDINPDHHQLLIHGLVKRPLTFSTESLLRYPMISRICFVECGGNSNAGWNPRPLQSKVGYFHGLASCSEWSGVPLALLLEEAGIQPEGVWIDAEGADAGAFHVSIPTAKALKDGFLALYQNGERLRPENGYPMRLILPGWEAVTHVKWTHRLNVVNQPVMSRDETAKYTEIQPDGMARQFTFVMEPKSLITKPSPGLTLHGPGLYQVSGLAWSGNGKVAQVDVSADGGQSWARADLQEPILDRCFTRFRIPWRWDGGAAILQSRVTDDTGVRQPTRSALIEKRGDNGYFHYHAIVSWKISPSGIISHVYTG